MVHVAYITGYGRSGSTILDMLLGCHPRVHSGGELQNLFYDETVDGGLCECGEPIFGGCAFWAEVFDRAAISTDPDTLREAGRVSFAVEALGHGTMPRRADAREYGRLWRALFDSMARVADADWIVDSSKTAWRSPRRPQALIGLADLDLLPIHLRRKSRAVVASRAKGDNRALEQGVVGTGHGAARTLVGQALAEVLAPVFTRGSRSGVTLRFENLLADPREALGVVLREMGLDAAEVRPEVLTGEQPVPLGHGVAGNRVRRSPSGRRFGTRGGTS